MIAVQSRKDRHLAVFGLGASGLATARALVLGGARVSAWDDDAARRDAAAAQDVPLADWQGCDWSDIDALVLAPGVPLTHPAPHPVVRRAQQAGRPVIGDIELLCEQDPRAQTIAITGTNGKSTTTSLIGHILHQAGRPVAVGGNIGEPALELDAPGPGGSIVLELSSFQLDLTERASFDIAVLLNISADHFDRHGDMAGYVAAKRKIFRDAIRLERQVAVIGVDDDDSRRLAGEVRARPAWRLVPVSGATPAPGGVYAAGGWLVDDMEGEEAPVVELAGLTSLLGRHNAQNAAAAYAACRAAGLPRGAIADALHSFRGLPHRQELVAEIGGVRYVNDSKATNPDSALYAIESYPHVYWIAGGRAKQSAFSPLAAAARHIRHAYLIGEAAEAIGDALPAGTRVTMAGDLSHAVEAAHRDAQAEALPGATVLLSPACASFDQFANYGARGAAFRAAVSALNASRRSGGHGG